MRTAWCLGVAVALAWPSVLGCTRTATQLVVVVESDLPAAAIASVRAEVRAVDAASGELPREETWAIPDDVILPFSFGLVPPSGDARRRVELDVEALDAAGRVTVRRRVRTGFLPQQSLRLPVFLAASCTTELERCESVGQTCVDGRCVSPDVPTESLTPVAPGSELADAARPDAGARADTGAGLPDAGVRIPATVVPVSVSSFGEDARITAITLGPDGDVYVGGSTTVTTTFFGTSVAPGLVIARLDSDGTPVWVRSWLATDQPSIEAVLVGAIDSASVGGGTPILFVLGEVDETAGATESMGVPRSWSASGMVGSNVFLAAVSPATGDVLDVIVVDGAGDESVSTATAGPGAITQRGDDLVVESHASSEARRSPRPR